MSHKKKRESRTKSQNDKLYYWHFRMDVVIYALNNVDICG